MSDQNKVIVKCSICGSGFIVTTKYRDTKMKRSKNNPIWKCKSCLAKESRERYKSLPDDEKQRRAEISKKNIKSYWNNLSDEEKVRKMKNLGEKFKRYRENLSEEAKKMISLKCSEVQKKRWENTSEEEKQRIIAPMINGFRKWWNDLSEEEKRKQHELLQAGNARWWNSLSDEEKEEYGKIRSEASSNFWNNITPEMRLEISERQSKNVKNFWDSMTEEEYKEWDRKRADGFNKYMDLLSEKINSNESAFMNMLNLYKLNYRVHWYNISVHPDFDKLFPYNPVTESIYVSPYHQWDFAVQVNDEKIYIDIDGSIHNPNKVHHEITYFNGKKVSLIDMVKFNDSKRLYQTDGYQAYIIKCYDDNLTENTPVSNIETNDIMTVKDLIKKLIWESLDGESQKEILDNL